MRQSFSSDSRGIARAVALVAAIVICAMAPARGQTRQSSSSAPDDPAVRELAGEVRGVSQIEKRIKEAARLGFERAIVPMHSIQKASKQRGIRVVGVETAFLAVEAAIGEFRRGRTKGQG